MTDADHFESLFVVACGEAPEPPDQPKPKRRNSPGKQSSVPAGKNPIPEKAVPKKPKAPPAPSEQAIATALRAHLFREYPSADQRVKKPCPERPFKVDDRDSTDRYHDIWSMHVTVPDPEGQNPEGQNAGVMSLELENVPYNDEVEELVQEQGGEMKGPTSRPSFLIPIRPQDGRFLRTLAKAIRCTVAKGQVYANRNWKWMAKRTADCLTKLAKVLDEFKRTHSLPSPKARRDKPPVTKRET